MPAALVTGGSSGIGAAACRRLRDEGWHVVGLARRPSPDADVSLCIDITNTAAMIEAVHNAGPLQLVVHSAGVIGPVTPFPESEPGAWSRTVEINLIGSYNVLRAALTAPHAPDRSIAIHLTSGAATRAKPHWSAYNASKAGAEHLMRSAARELEGSDRAVCALDPGITETAMQRELRAQDFPDRERFVRVYEQRSGRTPEQVAAAIWTLSQREPSAINGQTFRVGELSAIRGRPEL